MSTHFRFGKIVLFVALVAVVLAGCATPAAVPNQAPPAAATKAVAPTAVPAATAAAPAAATQAVAPTTAAPASAGAAQPVELRITWWGSQDRHDRTIKAIELYQKQNPNVKITYEFSSWTDYWTKLTTMAAGGNLPDIMQQDYAYITEWTSRNLLVALDDYAKSNVLNFADVPADYLDGGRVNGKLMGVNLGANSQSLVLDVDAFKKAGVELPSEKWTWADFEKLAMTLHDKLGIWGAGSAMWDEQHWGAVYLSSGSWRYNKEGTGLGYTDDKLYTDYLQMLLRLVKGGGLVPRPVELSDHDLITKGIETQPVVTNKAAMAYMWSNQIIAVWKAAGGDARNFKMYPLPRVAGGKSANYLKPSQFFSVTSQSKHPKEAAAFIDWFTNSIEANQILMAERGVPIASKVRDALKPSLGKSQQEMFDYISRVGKDVQPVPPADPPGHTDIVNNVWYSQVVDPVAYGKITPEQAVTTLRQQATTILAKNKK